MATRLMNEHFVNQIQDDGMEECPDWQIYVSGNETRKDHWNENFCERLHELPSILDESAPDSLSESTFILNSSR